MIFKEIVERIKLNEYIFNNRFCHNTTVEIRVQSVIHLKILYHFRMRSNELAPTKNVTEQFIHDGTYSSKRSR